MKKAEKIFKIIFLAIKYFQKKFFMKLVKSSLKILTEEFEEGSVTNIFYGKNGVYGRYF